MISAQFNTSALLGLSAMGRHTMGLNRSLERLATGRRINRASDDPAGMVAAESMTVRLKEIDKKIDGLIFEDKRLGAIEGAQSVLADLLQDLNGLVVQSANRAGMSQEELKANQIQANSIIEAINHISVSTTFRGEQIIQYMNSKNLGIAELGEGGKFNLIDGDSEAAQKAVESAIGSLATQQGGQGIRAKQIQSDIDGLRNEFENVSAARSQIVDTDYAAEVSRYVRASVLRDAAQFVTGLALKQNADLIRSLLG